MWVFLHTQDILLTVFVELMSPPVPSEALTGKQG
jgi:hypothetical protein